MYVVLDVKKMMNSSPHTRRRTQPLAGYNSTLLLRPGTKIDLIPPGSELRYTHGNWEVHMPISNAEIVKRLAKELDAIGWLIRED